MSKLYRETYDKKVEDMEKVEAGEWPGELYECQECGEKTPDIGVCFMCKETMF